MKRQTVEKLFIIAVFILTYTVFIQKVSLTGYAINFDSYSPPEKLAADDVKYEQFYVELNSNSVLALNNLEKGNTIIINQDQNKYNIVVMQVQQDYTKGSELVSLLVMPGEKRLVLKEGDEKLIDFNNDGKYDTSLIIKSISNNRVNLILESK